MVLYQYRNRDYPRARNILVINVAAMVATLAIQRWAAILDGVCATALLSLYRLQSNDRTSEPRRPLAIPASPLPDTSDLSAFSNGLSIVSNQTLYLLDAFNQVRCRRSIGDEYFRARHSVRNLRDQSQCRLALTGQISVDQASPLIQASPSPTPGSPLLFLDAAGNRVSTLTNKFTLTEITDPTSGANAADHPVDPAIYGRKRAPEFSSPDTVPPRYRRRSDPTPTPMLQLRHRPRCRHPTPVPRRPRYADLPDPPDDPVPTPTPHRCRLPTPTPVPTADLPTPTPTTDPHTGATRRLRPRCRLPTPDPGADADSHTGADADSDPGSDCRHPPRCRLRHRPRCQRRHPHRCRLRPHPVPTPTPTPVPTPLPPRFRLRRPHRCRRRLRPRCQRRLPPQCQRRRRFRHPNRFNMSYQRPILRRALIVGLLVVSAGTICPRALGLSTGWPAGPVPTPLSTPPSGPSPSPAPSATPTPTPTPVATPIPPSYVQIITLETPQTPIS